MIFQNVATYSYVCTYGLNAQPCIVWEGKMFIEYSIHTQDLVWSSRKNRDFFPALVLLTIEVSIEQVQIGLSWSPASGWL